MKSQFLSVAKIAFVSSALLVGVAGCSHNKAKTASTEAYSDTSKATAKAGGSQYVVVDFDSGSKTLSKSGREKLRSLATEASRDGREIDEIQVLAWADREYPEKNAKATRKDINLADDRAESVEDFIKDDLKTSSSVKKHNMAKRPGMVSELFKTGDFEVKTAFENSGAAPVSKGDASKFLEGSKASKAVIFVKYE